MNNMRNPNPKIYTRRNENASSSQKGCCSNYEEVKFVKTTDQGDTLSTQGNQTGEVSDSKYESFPNPSQRT